MTIAACYVSPEGVVLGADSTSTYFLDGGAHYFNHAQKLFELGEDQSLGVVSWGLGGLSVSSYRRLFALFSDQLRIAPPSSVKEVAERWIDFFWGFYDASGLVGRCRELDAKGPHQPDGNPMARTADEEGEFELLKSNCGVGFCIGGYVLPDRMPAAEVCWFDPSSAKPTPSSHPGSFAFWGAPNMIRRLIFGWDDSLRRSILDSGYWNGMESDLDAILVQQQLSHPTVPIRDAIDFVNSCILSTIKALKFSDFSQICGGPIELAVITADRPFRWVRHKDWDSALADGAA